MTAQALRLSGITKRFGENEVLKNVSMAIRAGEFLSVLGMSGCGKSTLLRVIAGLEAPERGRVCIDEKDITDSDPADRNLAMVFQSYALYPHMTVRQNIATPLRMRRLSQVARMPLIGRLMPGRRKILGEIDAEVARAAARLEIGALLQRRPAQLSGGQRQRVALARALVRDPAVFLMDEPLSNLDARLRIHMCSELKALHRRLGATFIYVTHAQVEAMTMSDRIALMQDGRILQIATPEALYQRPASLSVARFIGTPAINLVPIAIDARNQIHVMGQTLGLVASGKEAPRARCANLTLGLRPEDLRLASCDEGEGIAARILSIEYHGADRYLTLATGENDPPLTMRQSAALPIVSEEIRITFAHERAHFFAADGARIELTVQKRMTS